MSLGRSAPGCTDLAFLGSYPLSEPAEVALEDYARALLRCEAAEAVRTGEASPRVSGVHACGLSTPASQAALADIEDFARDMAAREGSGGLGWS